MTGLAECVGETIRTAVFRATFAALQARRAAVIAALRTTGDTGVAAGLVAVATGAAAIGTDGRVTPFAVRAVIVGGVSAARVTVRAMPGVE